MGSGLEEQQLLLQPGWALSDPSPGQDHDPNYKCPSQGWSGRACPCSHPPSTLLFT